MAVKFFGQFLIEQGVITRIDLLRAIDLQEKTNLRFGDLVISMGLMTREQVKTVHRAQRHDDLQFGDMAVKMGFMSQDQIAKVLDRQRREHLYIGEALVKLGALTSEQLAEQLAQFNREQKNYIVEKAAIPAGVPDRPIWEIVADLTYKMLTRIAGIPFRPGPCTTTGQLPKRPIIVEMGFSGAVSARYLLSFSETTHSLVANAILRDEGDQQNSLPTPDESIIEFVNIVCGNAVSQAARLGYSIDITPASLHRDNHEQLDVAGSRHCLMFPIYLSDGEVFEISIFIRDN